MGMFEKLQKGRMKIKKQSLKRQDGWQGYLVESATRGMDAIKRVRYKRGALARNMRDKKLAHRRKENEKLLARILPTHTHTHKMSCICIKRRTYTLKNIWILLYDDAVFSFLSFFWLHYYVQESSCSSISLFCICVRIWWCIFARALLITSFDEYLYLLWSIVLNIMSEIIFSFLNAYEQIHIVVARLLFSPFVHYIPFLLYYASFHLNGIGVGCLYYTNTCICIYGLCLFHLFDNWYANWLAIICNNILFFVASTKFLELSYSI